MFKKHLILFSAVMFVSMSVCAQETTVNSVLGLVSLKYITINTYNCIIDSFQKSGKKTSARTMQYIFSRPGYIYIKILRGANKGSSVIYKDGKVKACMGGVLSPFKICFKPENKMVLSIRGDKIYESGWGHSIETIKGLIRQGWQASLEKSNDINNNYLTVKISSPSSTCDNYFRVEVDPADNLIKKEEYFENGELASGTVFKSIELNIAVNPQLFD
jgi:hypothetical protein